LFPERGGKVNSSVNTNVNYRVISNIRGKEVK
jgi:hypothetical protein